MLNEVQVNTTPIKTTTTKNRRMLHHHYRREDNEGSNKLTKQKKKTTTTQLTRTNTVRQALHQHVVQETIAKQQQGRTKQPRPIQAATTILPKNAAFVLSLAPRSSEDQPDKENQQSKQWYTHQVNPHLNPATWKSSTINGSVHETTTTTTTQNTEAATAAVIVDEVLAMIAPSTTTSWTGNGTSKMISKIVFPASTVVSSKKKPLSSWYELCHYDNQQQQQRAGRWYQENFKNHAEDEHHAAVPPLCSRESDTAEQTPTTAKGFETTAVEGSKTLSTDNTMTSRPIPAVVSLNLPMIHDEGEPIHFTEDNDAVLVPIETTESEEEGVDRQTITTTTKTITSTTMPELEAVAVDVDDATPQGDAAGVVVVPAIVATAPTEIVAAVIVVPDATTPTPTTPAPSMTAMTSTTAAITPSNGTNHDGISTFLSPTTANFLTRPLLCTQPSRSSNNNSKCHSNVMDDTYTDNAGLYYDDVNDNGGGTKETYECFGFFRTRGGENGGTGCTIS